jgi:alpha,alpha-trehalase
MTEVPHLVCRFDTYSPEDERRRESLLLLGNGVLSIRGAATSTVHGETHYPGTYHGGTYNRLGDIIEGEAVENESLVNLPNWLPLEFRADGTGDWCAIGRAEVLDYRHSLDAAEATTLREATLRSGMMCFRLRERRLVSMCQPNVAALQVELTPLDWSGRLEIRSVIDGAVENAGVARHRYYSGRHLLIRRMDEVGPGIVLVGAETSQSRVRIAVAARTQVRGVTDEETTVRRSDSSIAQHIFCRAEAGHAILIEKAAVILTSRDPAISEPDEAACNLASELPDFDGLLDAHRCAWRRIWKGCRIRTEREDLGNALGFHASYLFQNTSPHTASYDTGIPSRGWQEGYHGHIFWDSVFSSEVLATRLPDVARSLLIYRYNRLDAARKAAKLCGLRGAMYPWRSAGDGRLSGLALLPGDRRPRVPEQLRRHDDPRDRPLLG